MTKTATNRRHDRQTPAPAAEQPPAVTALMTVEVASIAVLDHPFSPVARIQPSAMTDAIALLEAGRPGEPAQRDCGLSAAVSSHRVRTRAGSPSGTADGSNPWLLVTTVRWPRL
jgi:hypothetical protein